MSQIKFKTLESYSYGKRKLSINALKSISSTFNISPEEFLFKNIDLAKNIKIFCILNGLTQQELANSSNVSSTLLNAFLTGKHCIPNIIYIERIAKGLNISLEQLILGVPTEVEEVVLNPVKIGQNVRMILKERNMTFQQLADLSTLSIRTVSKFINGKHFGVYSLSSIANALNLPIKDIICYGLAIQEEFMDELVV